MKNKLIFLLLLVANFAFAQLPCGVPTVSSVSSTQKIMTCDNGVSKYMTPLQLRTWLFLNNVARKTYVDSVITGLSSEYIPLLGSNNIGGNLIANLDTFTTGLKETSGDFNQAYLYANKTGVPYIEIIANTGDIDNSQRSFRVNRNDYAEMSNGVIKYKDLTALAINGLIAADTFSLTPAYWVKRAISDSIAAHPGGAGGTVTDVSSANSDISVATGTTTPVLTLNSGSGANQIVKRDGSGNIANIGTPTTAVLTNATGLPLTTGVTGILPVANGGIGVGTLTGMAKGNGTSAFTAATAGDIGTVLGYVPADAANVKKFLGTIFDITPNASSGSLYTSTAPTSTFTFGSGGIDLSGADQTDPSNYLEYSSYYTCTGNWTRKIRISPSSDGNGVGIGIHSGNGDHYVRFACSGANKGKLVIASFRSGTVTTRVVSTALSYTNSVDMIEVTFISDMMGYRAIAGIINPTTGEFTGTPIGIDWTDPLTDGSISSKWAIGRSAIVHFGGSQTITRDFFSIEESVQKAVTIFGDSKAAGAYAGSAESMFVGQLNSSVQGGVAFVCGGGNRAADISNIQAQLLSFKSPILVISVGINDIIASTSTATIVGYIEAIAKVATKQGVLVFVEIPAYVTSSHASAGTINPAVDNLATSLNALTYIKTVDIRTATASGSSLNTLYAAADLLHLNALGNKQCYIAYLNALSPYVNMLKVPFVQSSSGLAYRQDQPSTVISTFTNASTSSSASVGIRTISDVANGFFNTYSSAAPGSYANKTALTNSHSGLVFAAFGSGGTVEMLSGGATIGLNTMFTFSPTALTGTANTNGAYTWTVLNSNTGSSALSRININCVNTSILAGAVSSTYSSGYLGNNDGFFTINSTATCKAVFGNQGANGTVAFIAGGSAAGNIYGNITSTGLWKIGDATAATAYLHIKAGTATANTAPLKFTSGTLLTTAEAGAIEFLTDKYYGTITTGAARKEITLSDVALNSGIVPVTTTNGRLTNTTVTTAEIGYVGGVTSSIQTQLNSKASDLTVATATDANYTITGAYQFVKLPDPTASRVLTFPAASSNTGKSIIVWNPGAGTFNWTVSAGVVKDASNGDITTLNPNFVYDFISDGSYWVSK